MLDSEKERIDEARRRLKLLGDLVDAECGYDGLPNGDPTGGVSPKTLKRWLKSYREKGLASLSGRMVKRTE